MLNGARLVGLAAVLVLFAKFIERRKADFFSANHVAGKIRHRHTTFTSHGHAVPFGDLGIDQHQTTITGHFGFAGNIDDGDALKTADLRRGNSHTAGTGTHGGFKLGDKSAQLVVKFFHGFRRLFQTLVRVMQNIQMRPTRSADHGIDG